MPQFFIFKEIPQPVERRWIIEAESVEEAEERMETILNTATQDLSEEDREGVFFGAWEDSQTMGDANDPVGNMEDAGEYETIDEAGEDNGIDHDFAEEDPDDVEEDE